MNNIMNHDKNPAMVVKDMCLWYSSTQALKDVNIEIEGQSITALIGPSGCGKSTFLKSLNRMNDINSSVSGRGIKVASVTLNGRPKNSS